MSISFLTILLNLIFFLLIFFISKKTVKGAIFSIIFYLIISILLNNSSANYWIRQIGLDSQTIRDKIIFNLDHCAPNFGLEFCRIIYNKPVFIINKIFTGIVLQFSEENILSFLKLPFRSILTIFCYVGILRVLTNKKSSNFIYSLRFWLLLYAFLGVFGNYDANTSKSFSVFLLFLVGYGGLITLKVSKKIYENFQKQ